MDAVESVDQHQEVGAYSLRDRQTLTYGRTGPYAEEVHIYKSQYGGSKYSAGKVGWGLRKQLETATVTVWPLRPVDSRQERWARVGGEKTSLLHQVKFDDILFGIEPVSEMWSPRPNSFSRNVFVIDIDTGIRAEKQLKLREGMQNIDSADNGGPHSRAGSRRYQ